MGLLGKGSRVTAQNLWMLTYYLLYVATAEHLVSRQGLAPARAALWGKMRIEHSRT